MKPKVYRWTRVEFKEIATIASEENGGRSRAIVPAEEYDTAELTIETPAGTSALTAAVVELMTATTPEGPWRSLTSPCVATVGALAAPPARVEGLYLGAFITTGEGSQAFHDVSLVLRCTRGSALPVEVAPAELDADVNDWSAFGALAEVVRVRATVPINLSGLAGGWSGRRLRLVNAGGKEFVLMHESGLSQAVNRFTCSTGADVYISPDSSTDIVYDGTSRRWRVNG